MILGTTKTCNRLLQFVSNRTTSHSMLSYYFYYYLTLLKIFKRPVRQLNARHINFHINETPIV